MKEIYEVLIITFGIVVVISLLSEVIASFLGYYRYEKYKNIYCEVHYSSYADVMMCKKDNIKSFFNRLNK